MIFALPGQLRANIMAAFEPTHTMQLGKRNALLAIAVGGLIAGALDITQAIILFGKRFRS